MLALIEALTSAVALRAPRAVQSASRILQAVRPWLHGAQGLPRAEVSSALPAGAAPAGAARKRKKASS